MHQPHLSWRSLTCKYTKHTLLFCLWSLKASRLPFMMSFGLQKHATYVFCCTQTFKCAKPSLNHAFLPLKTSRVHGFLHFNFEKHHSYFGLSFLTTVDIFYCLFWGFQTLNRYTVPYLFVDRAQKCNCYLYIITLTSKNICGTLFVVCLSLNMLFLPFPCILTWNASTIPILLQFTV